MQRRAFSHAFSAQSLREQEILVTKYVDLFHEQLKNWTQVRSDGVDAVEAFKWLMFDIIGELTFGESFNAVEKGETHPWVSIIGDTIRRNIFVAMQKQIPILKLLERFFVPADLPAKLSYHKQKTK